MSALPKKGNRTRYYDQLAVKIPEFSASHNVASLGRRPKYLSPIQRGKVVSRLQKRAEVPMAPRGKKEEEIYDDDRRPIHTPAYEHRTIKVLPTTAAVKTQIKLINIDTKYMQYTPQNNTKLSSKKDISTLTSEIERGNGEEIKRSTATWSQKSLGSNTSSFGNSTASGNTSSRSSDSSISMRSNEEFVLDERGIHEGMPYIPPLATDLVKLINTMMDSPPPTLSPFTFTDEVCKLPDEDFEQFIEEDTLVLKSAVYGPGFTQETFYDFILALTQEQFYTANEIFITQFCNLAYICTLVQQMMAMDDVQAISQKIEKEIQTVFGVGTCLIWMAIPSANLLINQSRLLKYPTGKGFIGTAFSENRRVIAPNPTASPIYAEDIDYPFVEDAQLILCEPIRSKHEKEVIGVIMCIDKYHKTGANYMYWPKADLFLLEYFSSKLFRVFEKFTSNIKKTAKTYKIIGKFISHAHNFPRLVDTLKSTVKHYMKCNAFDLYIKDSNRYVTFRNKNGGLASYYISDDKIGIAGEVFQTKKVLNIPVASDHLSFHTFTDGDYKSRSVLAIPFVNEDNVFAVGICRSKNSLPCFDEVDVMTMRLLLAGASPCLKLSMLAKAKATELRRAIKTQDRLGALLQTAESLSKETNSDLLLKTITTNERNLVKADRATLFVIDETHTLLISKFADGTAKPLLLPINQGIAGHVATSGEVVNIPDVYEDPRFNANIDKKTGYKTKSLMTIPVKNQLGHVVAVTQLMNKMEGESFTESDVELTRAMCVFTGIAISNSQVIETAIKSSKRIQALLDVINALKTGDSLSSVLHRIMGIARSLVLADRCALFLIDAETNSMSSTVTQGQSNPIVLKMGKGVVGYAAQFDKVVNIPDAYKDPRFHSGVDQSTGYRTRSILAIPVKDAQNRLIAVVEMINKDMASNGGIFTNDDEHLIVVFASFVGMAFDYFQNQTTSKVIYNNAIVFSNMLSSDESASCETPSQVLYKNDIIESPRFTIQTISSLDIMKIAATIGYNLGFNTEFQIVNTNIIRFLLAIQESYKAESWPRTIESTQFVYYFLKHTIAGEILSKSEQLALIIASICHHIGHEDTETAEQMNIGLSVLFQNRPPHEMSQCERTIEILTKPDQNILDSIGPSTSKIIWENIIDLILSTDTSLTFTILTRFKALVYPQNMFNKDNPAHRMWLMKMILKCSDASGSMRMFNSSECWAKSFKEVNPREQIGFTVFIARPLILALTYLIPEAKTFLEQLETNYNHWLTKANNCNHK